MYVNLLVNITGDHADDTNILGRSIHTVKKNTEALVVVSKKIGLEVNADKTKYMVMSRDQNAGRSHDIKIDNSCFERVEQFRYLGRALTNQNSIQEVIKSRLKLANACYHSVQNLLSSSLLSKKLKIKIYRIIIYIKKLEILPLKSQNILSTILFVVKNKELFTTDDTLKMIYYSCVHSIITYGLIFWGNSPHSTHIFKTQKRIIRIMTKSRRRDSCRQLFKK